jgi:hypothetical protein
MFVNPDEAFKKLISSVVDESNSLWESGLLFISKENDSNYQVELTGFYYLSENEREFGRAFENEREIHFSNIHKSVYEYLQEYYKKTNPKVKWNKLILEVNQNNQYQSYYELDGDEVSPNAPPEPEVHTAKYLCENLRNCLSHNAPNDYEWIWEVLERSKTEDGKNQIGGEFYYSLNTDKSEPIKLEPGEYIYMYNVSERLFEEYLNEETKDWNKIKLEFSKNGEVKYYVLC